MLGAYLMVLHGQYNSKIFFVRHLYYIKLRCIIPCMLCFLFHHCKASEPTSLCNVEDRLVKHFLYAHSIFQVFFSPQLTLFFYSFLPFFWLPIFLICDEGE